MIGFRFARIAVLLVGSLASGCGAPASTSPAPAQPALAPRSVRDSSDRVVAVPARPQRLLSLCTSATDTLIRLGLRERLAAIDSYSRVVPGSEGAVVVGQGSALSREVLLAQRIDLAFIWWFQDDAAALLADLGIPVVRLRCSRAADVPGLIRLIGACVASDAAVLLAESIEDFLHQAAGASPPPGPSVFVELYSPYKTLGSDTYTHDLIELAGGRNVAGATRGSVLFSAESLVQADPDVIVAVGEHASIEDMLRRPGWSSLKAVRARRVLRFDRYPLVAGAELPQTVARFRHLFFAHSEP